MSDTEAETGGAEADRAPGDDESAGHGLVNYLIGTAIAAGLTAASFAMLHVGWIYGPAIPAALLTLAVAQMGVHLVFFLHVTSGPDNTNNILALAFGLLIVLLVVLGSLWIMHHLDANMMPAGKGMSSM